ncbi:flagellar hook-associated protein 2 [Maridesulfovibrio ferrireducens]|uniref:Flagellar hook-associated protein 2 n=1 Tax=Maridesulfovibrio ferrireducens TaxID=246191 RepID=A0A1G9JJC5_9BACT|nr:flagellar filament capping protein FliD [Maridesulfovibrio ferrireducens]SDL37365.1 flagellar hook-associated protein 2 [Maridesulfovibrio ferrireducens]
MAISSLSSDVLSYSSTSISGAVTFSGLGNGTDFENIIDITIEAESYKKTQYEEDLVYAENAVEVLTTLDEELLSLSVIMQEMDEVEEFYSYTGSISGDELSAIVEDGAEPSSHNVVINQLAKKDTWVAEDYDIASYDTILCSTDSSIILSYAGEDISLDISAGTSAEELVNQINQSSKFDDKIEASLIYDGANYHLSFSGEETGAANLIEIKDLSALDSLTAADFNNTQQAQNAYLKINGYPSGADEWLERDSNTVDDLINNVTLTLNSTTDQDGIEVGISYDTEGMIEKVETFVTEINQIIYDIQSVTGRLDTNSDDEDESSFKLNDSTLDLVYNQIKLILSSIGQGFERYDSETGSGDLYSSLSMVGISTDSEQGSATFGQLVIDYDELNEALTDSPETVAELFSASGEASSSNSSLEIISSISGLTSAGEYDVEYEVSGGVIVSATINGVDMLIDGNTMLAQRDSDANGLYLEGTETTDGVYSATISVKQGKAGEIADLCSDITDVETGSIPLLISSYESSCTNYENEIYDESARLDLLETDLIRKYAALDEMLSYYSNIESQLETSLASLE